MSYILDALRKAERERAQGVAPPGAVWNPSSPPRAARLSRYRPLLLGVLCVLLVAALLITSAHDRNVAAEAAAQRAAAAAEPAPAAEPAVGDNVDDTAMTLQQQGPATLDDVVDNTDVLAPDESAALSAMVVRRDPVPPESAVPNIDDTTPAPALAPAQVDSAPVTEVEQVQLQPAPAPQIPRLKDMPADYRAAFPAFTLDVHVYDAAPQKRFIMIGGKRYNEGDTLGDGPHVAQIVPEGVIFDFRGEQVLFNIAHQAQ